MFEVTEQKQDDMPNQLNQCWMKISESIKNCTIYAVIVAGGKGLRMQSEIRKQYIEIAGTPLLAYTLGVFSSFDAICQIVLVIPEQDINYCFNNILLPYGFSEKVCMVSGGAERQQSVMNGLQKIEELERSEFSNNRDKKIVLIHDGVRPFVDHDIITRCIEGALNHGACIPVVPVYDTLKKRNSDGFVAGMVDRQNLYKVQTPQAFDLALIIREHENAIHSGFSATDDATLVEKLGKKVFMTQGSEKNIKITTQEDLLFAEYIASVFVTGNLI